MLSHEVKQRIEQGIQGAQVHVNEFSGGTDHYAVVVVSEAFEGVPNLKRHRMVMKLFDAEIDSGEVHALSIQPLTPEQFKTRNS